MSTPAFIDAFRALQTPAARREALAALSRELSSYEWRAMQALAHAKTFQFDIIGALPPELVFHIFSYLDTSTPFRLQGVSRRWRHLLRSTDLLKRGLRAWYDDTATFENASYEDYLREAQSIHRFRTGKCVQVRATDPVVYEDQTLARLVLVEDFLVDLSADSRVLRVTNLRNGEGYRACADNRARIRGLNASNRLIVFRTYADQTYVLDFAGVRQAKLQLPPFMNGGGYKRMWCREGILMCGGVNNRRIELYIWDLDSRKGKTLRIDQSPFDHGIPGNNCLNFHILPNPRRGRFTLFTAGICKSRFCGHQPPDSSIYYYDITFEGHLVQKNHFRIPDRADSTDSAGTSITSIRPVDRNGGFCVDVFSCYDHNGYCSSHFFDENLQRFMDTGCPRPTKIALTQQQVEIAGWKDSFYQLCLEEDASRDGIHLTFKHLGTRGQANLRAIPLVDAFETLPSTRITNLCINDKFAAWIGLNRIFVVSFGEKAKPADPNQPENVGGKLVLRTVSS